MLIPQLMAGFLFVGSFLLRPVYFPLFWVSYLPLRPVFRSQERPSVFHLQLFEILQRKNSLVVTCIQLRSIDFKFGNALFKSEELFPVTQIVAHCLSLLHILRQCQTFIDNCYLLVAVFDICGEIGYCVFDNLVHSPRWKYGLPNRFLFYIGSLVDWVLAFMILLETAMLAVLLIRLYVFHLRKREPTTFEIPYLVKLLMFLAVLWLL